MAGLLNFHRNPHTRTTSREISGPPTYAQARAKVHGDSWIGRFNQKVGLRITLVVGTMWAAYAFFAIATFSAPAAFSSHDPILIVNWISQSFLQLVLLPIIIVGQNIQGKAADARAQATFDDASATLHEAAEIQKHLAVQDDAITRILAALEKDTP